MEAFIERLIDFLKANSEWAFWISMAFAAAETTAFLSIVIPSTAILIGVGALVTTGALNFLPIFAGAATGALIGSTFSWWLGRHYGDRMLSLWPLRDHPEQVTRGREIFARWGPLAIIIGHFFGPLRPVAFLMCGMATMPLWWFQIFNLPGAIAWAYLVPKFGEVGGLILGWLWALFSGS